MSETKNYVEVHFRIECIKVNDIAYVMGGYSVDNMINPPNNKESINNIVWDESLIFNSTSKGSVCYDNGELLTFDETKYNDWVQPFVNAFNSFEELQQQQQEAIIAEQNKFENRQARALTQLNADFETVKNRAHLKSSLGFTIDANSTAKENVQGLIEEVGDSTVQFCDYYNQFHELNKSQLETLKSEINQNGQALYAQKWQYRTAIEQCSDNEGLDQVVAGIEFTYMDFTQQTE